MSHVLYLVGDVRARLAEIPKGSIDLVLTSWPYWLQRKYVPDDHPMSEFEIGQEPTVVEYLQVLLEVTALFGEVLAPHGSMALELDDTYSGSGGAGGDYQPGGMKETHDQAPAMGSAKATVLARGGKSRHGADRSNRMRQRAADEYAGIVPQRDRRKHEGEPGVIPPDKGLCMIPEMFRMALAYGVHPLTGAESPAGMWRVRNVVNHCRPNPSPGADADKYRPARSEWVVATRSRTRYWDGWGVRVPASPNTNPRTAAGRGSKPKERAKGFAAEDNRHTMVEMETTGTTSPLLDHWWEDDERLDHLQGIDEHAMDQIAMWSDEYLQEAWHIGTHAYRGAHYATFNPRLIAPFIEAMVPHFVCTECGEPERRILKKSSTEVPDNAEIEFEGWTSCGCEGDRWDRGRRGRVLDPFGGSATTGMVALEMGRDAVLIDFDDRNVDMARERVGMFLEVREEGEPL